MSCTFYRWEGGSFFGDYWCDKNNCRVDSDTYYRYCRDYNYSNCPIFKKNDNNSSCFITTVTCEILGFPDNHDVLNNLRNFRNNILQKDTKYNEILMQYDTIGPIIADKIASDKNNKEIANMVYNKYIEPISNFIIKNENEQAVASYKKLTLMLIAYYKLHLDYFRLKATNYDYVREFNSAISGHGKKLTK